jgi:hypothetical protein
MIKWKSGKVEKWKKWKSGKVEKVEKWKSKKSGKSGKSGKVEKWKSGKSGKSGNFIPYYILRKVEKVEISYHIIYEEYGN